MLQLRGSALEKQVVEPVEDIDKEECRGENSACVAINVVWILHGEDGRCLAAAALCFCLLLGYRSIASVAVRRLLCGLVRAGADLHGLVGLAGSDHGDGAVSIGLI